ncbi:unnamed protein product [Lymnaea stagnalis]|uniref:Secreted protein n=1 Tax=Lymnaea stagnalis TaxID=6523 RepID=A0AAV2IHZ2_LYMST
MSWRIAGCIFLTLIHLQVAATCKVYQIQSCRYFERISVTQFGAFIPEESHMQICSELNSALRCALDAQYTTGCSDDARIPYQSQYNVMKAVCTDRKQDYFNSTSCFFSKNLKMDIEQCLNIASYMMEGDDICEKIEETRDCVYKTFQERQGTCSETSKLLMGKLVALYLKPRGHTCTVEFREGEEDPTTTTTTQSTTATTTTERTTSTTPRALGVRGTLEPGEGFDAAVALMPSIVLNTLVSLVLVRLLG